MKLVKSLTNLTVKGTEQARRQACVCLLRSSCHLKTILDWWHFTSSHCTEVAEKREKTLHHNIN